MGDTIQCSGCHRVIEIARPDDVDYKVERGFTADFRQEIIVTVGHVVVHRCMQFTDGEWR
jgi:hypothetical protein